MNIVAYILSERERGVCTHALTCFQIYLWNIFFHALDVPVQLLVPAIGSLVQKHREDSKFWNDYLI